MHLLCTEYIEYLKLAVKCEPQQNLRLFYLFVLYEHTVFMQFLPM